MLSSSSREVIMPPERDMGGISLSIPADPETMMLVSRIGYWMRANDCSPVAGALPTWGEVMRFCIVTTNESLERS